MLTLLWNLSTHTYILLQHAPSNRLLNRLRTRDGLRWGTPAMLIGVAYLAAASGCVHLIDHGATEWLYLPFLLFFYNGLKFLLFGPWSLVLLAAVRWREHRLCTGARGVSRTGSAGA